MANFLPHAKVDMSESTSGWRLVQSDVAEPDFVWLRDLLSRAETLFLYRAVALWCKAERIVSLETFLKSNWREVHMHTLLSATRDRLTDVIDATMDATVYGRANRSSSTESNYDEQSIFCLRERINSSDWLDLDETSRLSVTPELGVSISPANAPPLAVAIPASAVLDTLDTSGDGVLDSVGIDTVGDGRIDKLLPLEIRASPRARVNMRRRTLEEQKLWLKNAISQGDAAVDTTGEHLW